MNWLKRNWKVFLAFLAGIAAIAGGWRLLSGKPGPRKTTTDIDIKHRKDPKDAKEADDIIANVNSLDD